MSVGVLHRGNIHQASFGYRDIAAKIAPDENTTYVVASLSKAFTSALAGLHVDDRNLNWSTRVQEILPDFRENNRDSCSDITITDLLCHRTGLPNYDGLWMLSGNGMAFERSDALPIVNSLSPVKPLRTDFIYNNFAYEIAGQVVEKIAGTTFSNMLHKRLLEPLGMTRTFFTDVPDDTDNIAKPYVSLENRSQFEIPMPLKGDGILFGAAGGMRSSIGDLLRWGKAHIEAGNLQTGHDNTTTIWNNPLKQMASIWSPMISLPFPSLREHTYALGWTRAQLPSVIGLEGPGVWNPIVAENSPSRLAIYHQGIIPGYYSFIALIPETSSVVVVLGNSMGLTEATKLVGKLLIEGLSDIEPNRGEYIEMAKARASQGVSVIGGVMTQLENDRTVEEPSQLLNAYTGKYFNSLGNYFIEIRRHRGHLQISFMGLDSETFDLIPYQHDSFYWHMTHDECMMRARMTGFFADYYIIKFGCTENSVDIDFNCIRWRFDGDVPGDGEVFQKISLQNVSKNRFQQALNLLFKQFFL